MGDSANTPSAAFSDEGTLLCPSCGYDLRGSTSERCSECGEIIDRALLATSGFPWAHRRKIGRIRAYVKTVWLVMIGSRKLRYETARPQELADARAFGRVTEGIVGLVSLGLGVAFMVAQEHLESLADQIGLDWPAWADDLHVPWLAGVMIWGAPVLLPLAGLYLSSAHARLFRVRSATDAYQGRADAIAQYMTAPMVLLLPASLLALLAAMVWMQTSRGWSIWFVPHLRTLIVLTRIFHRATRAGAGRSNNELMSQY